MEHSSLGTTVVQAWVERIRAGDTSASDELLRRTVERLEELSATMLAREPKLRALVEPADVLQNASLRLLRSLQCVKPASVREYYALAAIQIRRELTDLARHYSRQRRVMTNPSPLGGHDLPSTFALIWNLPDQADDADDLERWCSFHQAVERLPENEREAFELTYYHGCTQAEAAAFLDVAERTVRRWVQGALLKLHAMLKEE